MSIVVKSSPELFTVKAGNIIVNTKKLVFLGFTFRPRLIKTRTGRLMVSTSSQKVSKQ
ncbi:MAG: hypothetical protein QM487_09145 [Candidatus Marithrix sp.]